MAYELFAGKITTGHRSFGIMSDPDAIPVKPGDPGFGKTRAAAMEVLNVAKAIVDFKEEKGDMPILAICDTGPASKFLAEFLSDGKDVFAKSLSGIHGKKFRETVELASKGEIKVLCVSRATKDGESIIF